EVPFKRAAAAQLRLHARLEEAEGGAALVLGAVERDAGVLEHLVARLLARDQRDADAATGDHLLAVEIERLGKTRQHAVRQRQGALWLVAVVPDDRELVAADPRQPVARPDAFGETPGAGLE